LKRAISTAYYALFHTICRNCADCLIGRTAANRSAPAWRQAYRAVEHGFAKKQSGNKTVLDKFPPDIQEFASQFILLQDKRHSADYDPHSRFLRSDVLTYIAGAEVVIKKFQNASIKDRRAFAAWTAMKSRNG